jgi:large subunit ribosomal protein L30e
MAKQKKDAAPAAEAPAAAAAPAKGAAAASTKKTAEGVNSKLQLVIKSGACLLERGWPISERTRFPGRRGGPPLALASPPPSSPITTYPPAPSSGKYCLGVKQTLKQLRAGKSEMVWVSSNLPLLKRSEIEYYGLLAKTPVKLYTGSNVELGTACGKLFRVSCLSIQEPGDSDIIKAYA